MTYCAIIIKQIIGTAVNYINKASVKMKIDSSTLRTFILRTMQIAVLVSSILLIVLMSLCTFDNIPFLHNRRYLNFQLIICGVFLLDYIVAFCYARRKLRFFIRNLLFLIVSVPYINIINHYDITLSETVKYYIFLVPLIRAAFALAIVVGYVSSNRVSSLFASYISILLSVVYFSSLIFYQREFGINADVKNYGDALYWAGMNVTTLGASIIPVTEIGKILTVVLGTVGMLMFPLFTVYVTNLVQRSYDRENSVISFGATKDAGETDRMPPEHVEK